MARQNPTLEDIALPGVQGARPVAGYDVSGFGRGAEALARSGQTLGGDIAKSAQDIAEVQTYRARNSALLAQDNALGDAIQLRDKYQPGGEKYTSDPTALTQNYQTDLDAIAEKHLGTIPEGPLRDHARARLQIPFAHEVASVGAEARKRQIGDWRSGIIDEADSLVNTTGAQDDPLHTAKVQQWGQKVQIGMQQGYITPVEAEQLQRKTSRGLIDGEFRARFRAGPDSAAAALRDLYLAQSGIVGPRAAAVFSHTASIISKAETGDASIGPKALGNISPDSNGSRSYGFLGLNSASGSAGVFQKQYGSQFGLTARPGSNEFDAQWKAASAKQTDAFRSAQLKYFNENILPSVASNLEKVGVPVSAAADPRVSTYFADRQVQMGNAGLIRAGDAWERSGGDIERFLRNMNESDGRPENLRTNFASAIRSGVYDERGHATRLLTRLAGALAAGGEGAGGQTPLGPQGGGDPTGNSAFDILTPPHRDQLINEGHRILTGYRTDDEKARRDQERADRQRSDDTEASIVNDMRNPNSTISAPGLYEQYISKNLSREAYERMLNYYDTRVKNVDKEDHDAKTYGSAFLPLMQRINSPSSEVRMEGVSDPGFDVTETPQKVEIPRISDPSQITDYYTRHPDQLTEAGREKLANMITANRKDPDVASVHARMTSFLAGAKRDLSFEQIDGPIKIPDPKGERIYHYQFQPDFVKQVADLLQDAQKTGDRTKLNQFLSAENVQKMVRQYRNPNEMKADYLAARGEATGEAGAPPEEKLPPTPEGVNPAGWVPLISKPPQTASGKPWPASNWAAVIDQLRSEPTAENKQAFDERFGKFGLKADDVLGKLAAPQAGEGGTSAPESGTEPGMLGRVRGAAADVVSGFIERERAKRSAAGAEPPSEEPSHFDAFLAGEREKERNPTAAEPVSQREDIERQLADLDRQRRETEAMPEGKARRQRLSRIEQNRAFYAEQLKGMPNP